MDRATRANLRKLGFTQSEIEAIDREQQTLQEAAAPKRPTSLELAQKRYQARLRAARDGTPIPAWARKRS